jgi:hypothetical protein
VICTRFPVTSRNAKPYPVDEAIQGKKSVADFERKLGGSVTFPESEKDASPPITALLPGEH